MNANYNKEEKVRGLEFVPGVDFREDLCMLETLLKCVQFDFVLVPDNPLGRAQSSSLLCAKMLSDALNLPTIATISGSGKSQECIQSLILGAKYGGLQGIACVSGDGQSYFDSVGILKLARDVEFDYKICTPSHITQKIGLGATHTITQPIFSTSYSLPKLPIPVLPSFMPIFLHQSFLNINQDILGFKIPQEYVNAPDLMKANIEILLGLRDFYFIPLNLKKQMPYIQELFGLL